MKEFKKVIGYENIKNELYRIIDMMNNPEYYSKLGVKTTRGLLLEGEPGVGKTLLAECFIKASKRKVYEIKNNTNVYELDRTIKETFVNAKKNTPCIVFIDDLDKLVDNGMFTDKTIFANIQSCIDDCKDEEVFILATVNELHKLPHSLKREGRFDRKLEVNIPTKDDVEKIVAYYLKNKKVSKDANVKTISRLLYGKSCAALETVINEAGIFSGYQHQKEITMNNIVEAFLRIVFGAPDPIKDISKPCYEKYAMHEAGHVLVSNLLEPGSIDLASIRNCSSASVGGFVKYNRCNSDTSNIKHYENKVITLLAGKAAIELMYNSIDTGASSDVSQAYALIRNIIKYHCVEGFKYCEELYSKEKSMSQKLLEDTEDMVSRYLDKYYIEAKNIISNNKEKLIKIKNALLKKETIVADEIALIMDYPQDPSFIEDSLFEQTNRL